MIRSNVLLLCAAFLGAQAPNPGLGDPDPWRQGEAVATLAAQGEAALPSLRAALGSPQPAVRRNALTVLARLGVKALPLAPDLVKALGDPDGGVRAGAAVALGEAGHAPAGPALRVALADPDPAVRGFAAGALARLGAGRTPDPLPVIQALVPRLMAELRIPGASVAVLGPQGLVWQGGFGEAEAGRPVTAETRFEACSMSKPVLAYLALRLVDQGRLDLDRPLSAYLRVPAVPSGPERDRITARMALTHTSGLPNWRRDGEEADGPVPLRFQPGSRFLYSGEGIFLLQRVMEAITGQRLEALAEELLFQPLGMRHSSFVWTPAVEATLAAGHRADGSPLGRSRFQRANGAYTLYTTPSDYVAFLRLWTDPSWAGAAALAPATRAAALSPQVQVDAREPMERPGPARSERVAWGLGWGLNDLSGGTWMVYHSGSNQTGFKCYSQFDPARRTGLVVMTNSLAGDQLWVRLVSRIGDL